MNWKWAGLLLGISAVACSADGRSGQHSGEIPGLPNHSVVVPPFNVVVGLTPRASAEMKRRGETIVVLAVFASPANSRGTKYADEMNAIGWSDPAEVELHEPGPARFGPRKLNLALLDYFYDRKPEVLINVFSGRRTSKNNLLDCGVFEDSVYIAVKTGIHISCDLID